MGEWRWESGEQFTRVTCLPSCPEEGTFAMAALGSLPSWGCRHLRQFYIVYSTSSYIFLPSNALLSHAWDFREHQASRYRKVTVASSNARTPRARLIEQNGGDRGDVQSRKCSSSVYHAMIVDCGKNFEYDLH